MGVCDIFKRKYIIIVYITLRNKILLFLKNKNLLREIFAGFYAGFYVILFTQIIEIKFYTLFQS